MEPLGQRHAAPMPLVPVALLVAGGIAVGRLAPIPLGVWLAAAIAALAVGALSLRAAHLRSVAAVALALAVAATGGSLGHIAWRGARGDHIAAFVPAGAAPLATITGRIVTAPEIVSTDASGDRFAAYPKPPQTRMLLTAERVSTAAGETDCHGLVRVVVKNPTWRFKPSQRVRIAGRLTRPGAPGNPGQFDQRAAARRSGVWLTCTAEADEAVEVLGGKASWLSRLAWLVGGVARSHLQVDGNYSGRLILKAILFGDRQPGLRAINDALVRAGAAHLLSISGLHLGVLLGAVYLVCRLMQLAPRTAATVVLIVLGAYLLVAQPRAPLIRASLMAAAFCMAVILGRTADTANLLAAAGIVMLAVDPTELFRPGFQLSFGIVAGILLLHRPVRDLLFGRWLRRRGLMVFRDDQRVRRWLWHNGLNATASVVAVSVAAYAAALPLVAYHFGLITPLAPVVSLALFPLVAAALLTGYAQVLLAPLAPNLAGQLAYPLGALGDALGAAAEGIGALPGLCIELSPVPPWAALAVGAAIVLAACRGQIKISRAWAAVVLTGGAVVLAATQCPSPAVGRAELAVLNVGNGMCGVLRCPSGPTVLLDAGSRTLRDAGRDVLAPFLRHRHWPSPAAAFVSHDELDHYNALPALLSDRAPERLFVNERFAAVAKAVADERPGQLLEMLDEAGTTITRLHRGQCVQIDRSVTVTCLWPPADLGAYGALSANDSSLVLRLDCDGVRTLLPGDVQHLGQQLLLELPRAELAADVLVLPHHGSATPVLDKFIEAVDPRIVIRSSAFRRTGATREIPSLAVHREFFATGIDGGITVEYTADGPRAFGDRTR